MQNSMTENWAPGTAPSCGPLGSSAISSSRSAPTAQPDEEPTVPAEGNQPKASVSKTLIFPSYEIIKADAKRAEKARLRGLSAASAGPSGWGADLQS